MTGIPPVTGLRAFESVARLLSFSDAANELGVTPSAISHQIAGLEEMLGVRLFQRTRSKVALTEQGSLLSPYIREGFEKIAQGLSLVASESGRLRTLRLQIYITVAARWLLPRLPRFHAHHPAIKVHLDTKVMDWDFDPNHTDLGFIYAVNPHRDGVEYTEIHKADLVLICTKTIAKRLDLHADPIRCRKIEVVDSALDWHVWFEKNGFSRTNFESVVQFDSLLLGIGAALAGEGLLVIPKFMVQDDLDEGRLVSPYGRTVPQLGHWYLARPNARKFDKAIQSFERWLKAEFHSEAV